MLSKLLNNDINKIPVEEHEYAEKFNQTLRQELLEEFINDKVRNLKEAFIEDNDEFRAIIEEMIVNGCKPLKDLTTKQMLDLYLQKCGEEEFIKVMERVTEKI